jgi:hypothetical protein
LNRQRKRFAFKLQEISKSVSHRVRFSDPDPFDAGGTMDIVERYVFFRLNNGAEPFIT